MGVLIHRTGKAKVVTKLKAKSTEVAPIAAVLALLGMLAIIVLGWLAYDHMGVRTLPMPEGMKAQIQESRSSP